MDPFISEFSTKRDRCNLVFEQTDIHLTIIVFNNQQQGVKQGANTQ